MLTFVGFLYSYLFLGTCVLESINFIFFLLNVFLVIVGANEMFSQWLVPVLFVCFLCLLQVNNLLVFFRHVSVFCLGTCVFCWMFFRRPINHSFIHSKFDRCGISGLHHQEVGKRLIRIILRDMNTFCSLSFSYIRFC